MMWHHQVAVFTLTGVGEGLRSLVVSPQVARIQEIRVAPYQMVRQGDPIAIVVPLDTPARIDLLRAEMQLAQFYIQPSLAEANSLDFERIRVELLRHKSELAIARVNLDLAEKDVRRNTPLHQKKLVSDEIYDLSVKTRDLHQAEVEEKMKAIAEIESRMSRLSRFGDPDAAVTNEQRAALMARLEQARNSAATNLGPIVLTAPITGMAGTWCRNPGEHVAEGEPILVVHSQWSDRIVGYLRQPYQVDPQVGMPVQATTRTRQRLTFSTEILQVGAQVETLTNSLAFFRQGMLVDVGLPIVVRVPPEVKIRPGEMVDLLIQDATPKDVRVRSRVGREWAEWIARRNSL